MGAKNFFQALTTGDGIVDGGTPFDFDSFFVVGDSIAFGTSNGTAQAQEETLYEWINGQLFERLEMSNVNTGSWMPAFADQYKLLTGKRSYFVKEGYQGAEFAPNGDSNNWSTSGDNYGQAVPKAQALQTEVQKNIRGIIVILGINDARSGTALATIETDANSLMTRLNTDFPNSTIYIVQIGREETGVTQKVLDVRDIISNGVDGLVETYSYVKLAASLADNPNSDFYDNLHLSQTANNELGVELANFINNN